MKFEYSKCVLQGGAQFIESVACFRGGICVTKSRSLAQRRRHQNLHAQARGTLPGINLQQFSPCIWAKIHTPLRAGIRRRRPLVSIAYPSQNSLFLSRIKNTYKYFPTFSWNFSKLIGDDASSEFAYFFISFGEWKVQDQKVLVKICIIYI